MSDLIKRIARLSQRNENEIKELINLKVQENPMISKSGAMNMVVKDLGVDISKTDVKINEITPDMKAVEIEAKVTFASEKKDFKTSKASGSVQNLFLADETGSIRMSLWNDEIERYSLAKNDVIRVKGYLKDGKEIRLGNYGGIEKTDSDIELKRSGKRKEISEMKMYEVCEIKAAIVQIFENEPFFKICPACGKSVKENICEQHGEIEPKDSIVINGILDDGTDTIRFVAFGELAEKLLGKDTEEALNSFRENLKLASVFNKVPLGKEFIITGKMRENSFSKSKEFIVYDVKEVDTDYEIKKLIVK